MPIPFRGCSHVQADACRGRKNTAAFVAVGNMSYVPSLLVRQNICALGNSQWVRAHSQRDVAAPDIFLLKDPKRSKQNYPSKKITWEILHTMSNFQQAGLKHWLFHWLPCHVARPIMLLPMHTWMSLRVWELHMDYLRCRFNGRVWQRQTSLDATTPFQKRWIENDR